MLDYWLWDLVDGMRHEEEKIAGNTQYSRSIGERSRGELASELGISSQLWLSRAYLSPLMAQGYIAQTLPKKPKSPLQHYRLLRKGKDVLV